MRYRYRAIFNASSFDTDRNAGVDGTKITADVADQQSILENYRESYDTSLTFQHSESPFLDDRAGFTTYLRSFTINHDGLLLTETAMVQMTGQNETHQ